MAKKNKKKSTFFSDFKAFITKGNIMDMAVGVVIGGAFSAIVNSLVNDIIMPLLTLATGDGVQGLSVVLNGVSKYLEDGSINPEAVLWNYGNFIQTIINFLIIALCIFTALRIIMNIRKASDKLTQMAKKGIKGEAKEEQAVEQPATQEAVADIVEEKQAEEVKEEVKAEEVKVEEVKAEEVKAEEVKVEEIEAATEVVKETVEEKETQEDLLKQIRDLLMTMQPQPKSEKTSAAKTSAKTSAKPVAKKTSKSAK